jgi:hypothetical protein
VKVVSMTHRVVAHVGEGVRRTRRDRDPRAGADVVVVLPDGESHVAREHVEAFVVLCVTVLRSNYSQVLCRACLGAA